MNLLQIHRFFLRTLLPVLGVACLAVACASTNDVGSNTSWTSCRTTQDCSRSEACVRGRCVPAGAGISIRDGSAETSTVDRDAGTCTGACTSDAAVEAGPACTVPPQVSDNVVGITVMPTFQTPSASVTGKVVALVPLGGASCADAGVYDPGGVWSFYQRLLGCDRSASGFVLDSGVRVILMTPFAGPIVQIGQTVQVVEEGPLSCGSSYLTLRDDSNHLLAWGSQSPSPCGLSSFPDAPNEVSVRAGAPRCWVDDGCTLQNFTDLSVSIGGSSFTFTGSGTEQLGEYVVTYNGGPSSVSDVKTCGSPYSAPAGVIGVVHGDLATLESTPTCGGKQCAATEYCDIPIASGCFASDTAGACKPRPTSCPTACDPVAACDGNYYCNDCEAHRAGVSATDDALCGFTGQWNWRSTGGVACGQAFYCKGTTPADDVPSYEARCPDTATEAGGCECLHNGKVVGTAGRSVCRIDGSGAVEGCNFPKWLLPAP